MGIGAEGGSCWHKQLLLCRRSVDDIRFRIFAKVMILRSKKWKK